MKWSTVLVVASIGIRVTDDQVVPLVVVAITMSLEVHEPPLARKRQSCQTTYTFPAASISAEGSGPLRRLPRTVKVLTVAMVVVEVQVLPPLVDRKARIDVSEALEAGTITVPPGWTTGWPPRPVALLPVFFEAPQVRPPSLDVVI